MASDFEVFGFGALQVDLSFPHRLEGIVRDVHRTDPAKSIVLFRKLPDSVNSVNVIFAGERTGWVRLTFKRVSAKKVKGKVSRELRLRQD